MLTKIGGFGPKFLPKKSLVVVASLEVYRPCMGTITVKKIKDATLRTSQLEPKASDPFSDSVHSMFEDKPRAECFNWLK